MIICDHYENKYGQARQRFRGWSKILRYFQPIESGEIIWIRYDYNGVRKWVWGAGYNEHGNLKPVEAQ